MRDVLLEMSQNPTTRRLIKQLGLPIPTPVALRRTRGPWAERPLADRRVVVGGVRAEKGLNRQLADTLTSAGAMPVIVTDESDTMAPWSDAGEAFGRPPIAIEPGPAPDDFRTHGLVYDATWMQKPGDLKALYDFFHPWIRCVARSGRIVIVARPPSTSETPCENATRAALSGFVKSIAKETGKRGATAQFVYVEEGAEAHVKATLRWLLSDRSAFVDGQAFTLSQSAGLGSVDPPWTYPLEGKTALVTGAARGIGAATARALAQAGAAVTVLDLPNDDAPASAVARAIDGELLLVDITSPEAGARIQTHFEARGGLDIVVHNAGVTRDKTLAKMRPDHWALCVDVNLRAVTDITDALMKAETINSGGRVVGLSSIAGIAGNMGQTNYAASKSGVLGYVRALASHPATRQRGVTVNAVAPGFIETRLTDRMPAAIREVARRFNALSQGGKPQDVAETILFLASPGAQGITGNVIRVCGLNMVGA